MKHGDPDAKRANIHPRKDEAVETAKAKTSPKQQKGRNNVNPNEQLKVQKEKDVRKVIGPRYQGMEKVRRQGRKDR